MGVEYGEEMRGRDCCCDVVCGGWYLDGLLLWLTSWGVFIVDEMYGCRKEYLPNYMYWNLANKRWWDERLIGGLVFNISFCCCYLMNGKMMYREYVVAEQEWMGQDRILNICCSFFVWWYTGRKSILGWGGAGEFYILLFGDSGVDTKSKWEMRALSLTPVDYTRLDPPQFSLRSYIAAVNFNGRCGMCIDIRRASALSQSKSGMLVVDNVQNKDPRLIPKLSVTLL